MSGGGIRLFSYREGDRAEYLANYLLSGLGLVTAVSRQEDIGFDFYCQLADQEQGSLSFGFPFIVQIKSDSVEIISFGNDDPEKWNFENITWLTKQEIPLLFGFVDKKGMSMSIYNSSAFRFLLIENPQASRIEFIPRLEYKEDHVGRPEKIKIDGWPESGKGDGHLYKVDMGHPIITLNNEDIYDKELLKHKKNILRQIIILEQQNILFQRLHLPHFHWAHIIRPNEGFHHAWYHNWTDNPEMITRQFKALGAGLVSLAIHLHASHYDQLIENIKPLLRMVPDEFIHAELIETFPDLFR